MFFKNKAHGYRLKAGPAKWPSQAGLLYQNIDSNLDTVTITNICLVSCRVLRFTPERQSSGQFLYFLLLRSANLQMLDAQPTNRKCQNMKNCLWHNKLSWHAHEKNKILFLDIKIVIRASLKDHSELFSSSFQCFSDFKCGFSDSNIKRSPDVRIQMSY